MRASRRPVVVSMAYTLVLWRPDSHNTVPSAETSGLGWLTSSDEFGGWIAPIADTFVDRLLATKPGQTQPYQEAWLVSVDRVGLVDSSDVIEALARRELDIPANWSRVWFLPATDSSSVTLVRPGTVSDHLPGG